MKFARLLLVARRNFLMGPRTMSDSPFEQSKIIELVSQDGLEEVQIGNRFGVLQDELNYKQTPEACLKKTCFRRWEWRQIAFVSYVVCRV